MRPYHRKYESGQISQEGEQLGYDVVASTPEEFAKFMQEEVGRWTKVVQRGGITPD